MTANAALVRADLGNIQTKLTVGLVTPCESTKYQSACITIEPKDISLEAQ